MRVIEIVAENFMRLSLVRFRPTGPVTAITGRNGQGKTSCLDAVAAAFGGAALCPAMPIRKGEAKAHVSIELDDLVVTRRWTAKSSSLEVATKEGAAYKSPQAVLDKLVGELSFDPLAFGRMKPLEQAATLARVAKIDLDAHRAKRAALFADRATANKTAKELRAQAAGMSEHADAQVLIERVSNGEAVGVRIVDGMTEGEPAIEDGAPPVGMIDDRFPVA